MAKKKPDFNVYGKTAAKPVKSTMQMKANKGNSLEAKKARKTLVNLASLTPAGRAAAAAQFNKSAKLVDSLRKQYKAAKTAEQKAKIAEAGKRAAAAKDAAQKALTSRPLQKPTPATKRVVKPPKGRTWKGSEK